MNKNKSKKFTFDKLIRDGGYEYLLSEGASVSLKLTTEQEKFHYHKKKVLEEAMEVLETKTEQECLEELADLLEIIEALASKLPGGMLEIQRLKKEKAVALGSFNHNRIVEYVEVPEDHKFVSYYRAAPNKYIEQE